VNHAQLPEAKETQKGGFARVCPCLLQARLAAGIDLGLFDLAFFFGVYFLFWFWFVGFCWLPFLFVCFACLGSLLTETINAQDFKATMMGLGGNGLDA